MKKFLLPFTAFIMCATFAHSTIRRIGFFLSPVTNVDYPSFQAAHDASSAGDTILVLPLASVNGNISKPLVLIGPGYFLDSTNTSYVGNGGLQANTASNEYAGATLTFLAGSSGTILQGLTLNQINFNDNNLNNNILIERCDIKGNDFFNTNAGNITYQQCVIENYMSTNGPSTPTFTVANLSFFNCLFNNNIYYANMQLNFNQTNFTVNGTMSNCVVISPGLVFNTSAGAWLVTNSVFVDGAQAFNDVTNIIFIDNISCNPNNEYPFNNTGSNSGNLVSTLAKVFALKGSYDGQYVLAAGSPAIGTGQNGSVSTDIGLFGGQTPYVLSGIPPIPTIYRISSPDGVLGSGSTYTINLSTRSNN
jgi:hypothetical protein